MTGTWTCVGCGKPVPAQCDGGCNKGTTAERTNKPAPKPKK